MVGSPYQTYENLVEDILFLKKLKNELKLYGEEIVIDRGDVYKD